jgi:hypothetical protein
VKNGEEGVRAGAVLPGVLLAFIYKESTLERCSTFGHMFLYALTLT